MKIISRHKRQSSSSSSTMNALEHTHINNNILSYEDNKQTRTNNIIVRVSWVFSCICLEKIFICTFSCCISSLYCTFILSCFLMEEAIWNISHHIIEIETNFLIEELDEIVEHQRESRENIYFQIIVWFSWMNYCLIIIII